MIKYFSAIFLSLIPLLARAVESSAEAPPPVADTDPTAMIIFILLMIAMIGGFAIFIWRKERERKEHGHEQRH